MKRVDLILFFAAAACVGGAWYARRVHAAKSCPSCPQGFSWDKQLGAFSRVNAQGERETYAKDVYL